MTTGSQGVVRYQIRPAREMNGELRVGDFPEQAYFTPKSVGPIITNAYVTLTLKALSQCFAKTCGFSADVPVSSYRKVD